MADSRSGLVAGTHSWPQFVLECECKWHVSSSSASYVDPQAYLHLGGKILLARWVRNSVSSLSRRRTDWGSHRHYILRIGCAASAWQRQKALPSR